LTEITAKRLIRFGLSANGSNCLVEYETQDGATDRLDFPTAQLDEVIGLAAELTNGHAVIEFVGQDDPMFRAIARGREDLHRDLTVERFEAACRERFEIVRRLNLPESARSLYLLRRAS